MTMSPRMELVGDRRIGRQNFRRQNVGDVGGRCVALGRVHVEVEVHCDALFVVPIVQSVEGID